MKTNLFARRNFGKHNDGAAFLELSETGKFRAYGKFYDNGRGFPGPEVCLDDIEIPTDIAEQIEYRSGWGDPMSAELESFVQKTWDEVQRRNAWFDFDAKPAEKPKREVRWEGYEAYCGHCGRRLSVWKNDKTGYSWSAAECSCK